MTSSLQLKASVVALESAINDGITDGTLEDAMEECPVTHHFAPPIEEYGCGTYARELFIPKGVVLVGKIHRHSHLSFLMKGEVIIVSEKGKEQLKAPYTFVSPIGAKRAFYAVEDSIITTVHLTKHTKEPDIEQEVISESFTELGLEEPDLQMFYKELEKLK
jgi:hypothetical protein